MTEIQKKLFEMQDLEYKKFHCKLMPNISEDRVIGVRTPKIRSFASTFEDFAFLNELPHFYYEENNLHAFLIEKIPDFEQCLSETDRFLPYIDNWATCDLMNPKALVKSPHNLLAKIDEWLKSESTYTVRYGIKMLMNHFLTDMYDEKFPLKVASVENRDYYITMMKAWYFATALAKRYNETLPYFEQKKLDTETHNKAIQKARESLRISNEQKDYLKTLKIRH